MFLCKWTPYSLQGPCESQVGSVPDQPLPALAHGGQGGPGSDRELRCSSGSGASARCSGLGQHPAPDQPAAPSARTSWAPREKPAVGGAEGMTPTVPTRPDNSLDREPSKAGNGSPDPTSHMDSGKGPGGQELAAQGPAMPAERAGLHSGQRGSWLTSPF